MTDTKAGRRRHPRVSASFQVKLSTIEPERDPWTGRPFFRAVQETCSNVSRGGTYVNTAEPLAPGRRVLVEIKMQDGDPLEAIGRVAWSKRVLTPQGDAADSGIGIEFLGASREEFSKLEYYIDERDSADADRDG